MLVTLNIPDDLVAALIAQSKEAGTTPVEAFIEELLRDALEQPAAESTLVETTLHEAIQGLDKIPSGEEFFLEDVLDSQAWSAMSNGERKSLGRRFRKAVESKGLAEWQRRNYANKAVYKRT
ncbi:MULTISPECIES: DUF1413 domain-containing protein [Pseudomonas]|uniref:Uncharacterized protein n=1 Tax=Pseudomonas lutea TaxID=243924 RepID=A0A9X8MHY4_9PSED|nr:MULTISPECIES: DUF1413 domain-containing protein [Pseudomonas]SER53239.1 protein of unknown function [Pseudomonas lutea]